jgi:hypothetical protein
MRAKVLLIVLLLPTASSVACSSGQVNLTNPTGACGTRSDGGRAGYHGPSATDQWVPDCQNTLLREYWRVFSQDGKTAYVIPRPDGAPELSTPCTSANHELHDVVVRYELCSFAENTEQVNTINNIELPDALRVTHFLHTQLKFVVTQDVFGIQPFPIPSDIIDACVLGGQVNSAELESICQTWRDTIANHVDGPLGYTGPGAVDLVMRLNQLYGIP